MRTFKKTYSLLLSIGIFLGLMAGAWAASSFSNESGKFNGDYRAKVRNLTTKEVFKKVPIEIEGMYVTVKFKDGEKRWKFEEILDRRYEKEIVVHPLDSSDTYVITFE